jgi:hypothetical protein
MQLSDFPDDENDNDGDESDREGPSALADDFSRQLGLESLHPSHSSTYNVVYPIDLKR